MERLATAIVLLALAALGPTSPSNQHGDAGSGQVSAPERPSVEVEQSPSTDSREPLPGPRQATPPMGGTEEERETVDGAIRTFAEHGLALPTLIVRIHPDKSGCKGYSGLYSSNGREHRVDVCHVSDWVVIHELAHAWEAVNTSPEIRQAFMDHEEVDTWADEDTPWGQRGTERAANVVAHVIRTERCDDIGEAFRILTGTECPYSDG